MGVVLPLNVHTWASGVDLCIFAHTLCRRCTYKWRARRYLPATESTVILYLCHLRDEGQMHESSLNPYMAAINQTHEDLGFPRPALAWAITLPFSERASVTRKVMTSTRTMSVLPGRTSSMQFCNSALTPRSLPSSVCVRALCFATCWYNRADTGMLVLRRDVTIDDFGITINQQGKTIAHNQACPVHQHPDAPFD